MTSRMLTAWLGAALISSVLASASPLQAQRAQQVTGASSDGQTSARRWQRAGMSAFAKGRYTQAIRYFEAADRAQPNADFSYNVARAYQALGDDRRAIASYRDYLARAGEPEDAQLVRQRIAQLQAHLEAGDVVEREVALPPELTVRARAATEDLVEPADAAVTSPAGAAVTPPVPAQLVLPRARQETARDDRLLHPVRRTSSPARALGIVLIAGGAAALGGALTFELLRSSAESDASRETRQIQYARDLEVMQSRQLTARILLGAGATLTLTGVLFVLVTPNAGERGPGASAALGCTALQCGVIAQARY